MSRRLSPKEIKQDIRQDELRTTVTSMVDWLALHRREVTIGAAVVVGVALAGAGFAAWMGQRREAATAKLAEAIEVYRAPLTGDDAAAAAPVDASTPRFATEEERRAAAKEAFTDVAGFGSGTAGDVARLYLADVALAEGDAARARELWEGFLAEHDDHVLAANVRVNLIHLDREEGRGEELAGELRAALEEAGGTLPEDVVLYELGQTLESLEQPADARDVYQRIVDEHPQSPYASRARQRTAELS